MKNRNYFNWFINDGWKKYLLVFLLVGFIDISFLYNFSDILAESESNLVTILIVLLLSVITIANVYHSIDYYRNTKKDKN